jgi:polysaccharide deacetylase 2 family uncharacterized protein YibQ
MVTIDDGPRTIERIDIAFDQSETVADTSKKLALVIDDIGYKRDLSEWLELGIPVTFAILPQERFSKDIAKELSARDMPYLLHLPLEPEGFPKVNPGKAALLTTMTDNEIKRKFQTDPEAIPGIRGVSNHMGSRFSTDAEKMRLLLGLVKGKDLFYFDSYTTPKSKAKKIARELQLTCKVNEMFVDLRDDPDFMRKQFDGIEKTFSRQDEFVAIGHIQKKNLIPVLKEYILRFKQEGISFVYLTDILGDVRQEK